MGLETGTYLDDLNSANPTANDYKYEGDDHLRFIKSVLLATFPNLTGAMTSNQSELNRLDALVGGFLTDAIADASGTDTITCTFSPAITLTDKTTVMVRAAGANTSTTPTFNPNSLGAKTIVKNGNQALVAGDIPNADFVMVLQYSSSNDVWELVNAPSKTATTYSGFVNGQVIYFDADSVATKSVSLDVDITKATWESVGPTGSGATNINTSFDSLPTTCIALIVRPWGYVQNTTAAHKYVEIGARPTGSSGSITYTHIVKLNRYVEASANSWISGQIHIVAVDSSNRIDCYWDHDCDNGEQLVLEILGFIDGD